MNITIQPGTITGTIQAPISKSSMQRACAAALLFHGKTDIIQPGYSNDDKAALDIIQKLGAVVDIRENELSIISTGVHPISNEINCGESGLSIRMFTPIAALSKEPITITGEGSLPSRPMDFFDGIFPQINIQTVSNKGKLPLRIQGPLEPKNIEIDGSLSSQFLTGMLMAYSAAGASNVSIRVKDLKSKPYIDLTLKVMKDFGMHTPENRNYQEFYYPSTKPEPPAAIRYEVEGDWSGGAFLLVAGAIAGNITVKGLDVFSTQADRAVLQAIIDSGARISIETSQIEVGPAPLKAFHFNATDCPDLFPPLVALAAYCEGRTIIEGVSRLAHKESNRGLTLQEEFGKMGVEILLQEDLMIINGGKESKRATVHSRHDHRIAMACAVAGLRAQGPVTIEDAEAINKSYPDFYGHLRKLGADVEE